MSYEAFSEWSAAELRAAIRANEEAISSNVTSVTYNGRSTTYNSVSQLIRVNKLMKAALAKADGNSSRPYRKVRVSTGNSGW